MYIMLLNLWIVFNFLFWCFIVVTQSVYMKFIEVLASLLNIRLTHPFQKELSSFLFSLFQKD